MTTLIAILKALVPLIWSGIKKVAGFLTAERSILGMFATGLVLCLTGQLWAGILMFAKAAFLLFAAAFGFHLATQGVKVTMLPLLPQDETNTPS